jgi:GNAT superfamily N-acetyltransferase
VPTDLPVAIVETRPNSPDAVELLAELDRHLQQHPYPDESRHALSIDQLVREGIAFFVARYEGDPAGCGGVKLFGTEYGEVKRMYVRPAYRGLGLGKAMLRCLVECCRGRRVNLLRLETGIYQSEAMRLYERFGFRRRQPFGEYREDPNSVYYEMQIAPPEEPNGP